MAQDENIFRCNKTGETTSNRFAARPVVCSRGEKESEGGGIVRQKAKKKQMTSVSHQLHIQHTIDVL